MSRRDGPLKRRASGYAGRVSRLVRLASARSAKENRSVYCGDHVLLTRVKNGRRIYLDMRDAAVAPIIALGDEWEPHVASVLRALARPGDTFFDVGANVGYHSLLIWDVVTKADGQVHLFEPNPVVHRLLQRTFHANGFWRGTHLQRLALSDENSHATLTVYEDLWGSARLQSPGDLQSSENPWASAVQVGEQFDVPTMTVDRYCVEHDVERIDLMKIDTEGHEDAVFAGMKVMTERSPQLKVVLEFTFGAYSDASEFWALLTERFPHRYLIEPSGSLTPVRTLDDLRSKAPSELADILVSKVPAPTSNISGGPQ